MNPACPKCGKPMRIGSRAGSGKIRWTCREGAGEPFAGFPDDRPGFLVRDQGGSQGHQHDAAQYVEELVHASLISLVGG